jgi:hypothetical protein
MSALSHDDYTVMLNALMDAIEQKNGDYRDAANAAFALLATLLAKCNAEEREVILGSIEDGALHRKVSASLSSGVFPLTEADAGMLH